MHLVLSVNVPFYMSLMLRFKFEPDSVMQKAEATSASSFTSKFPSGQVPRNTSALEARAA